MQARTISTRLAPAAAFIGVLSLLGSGVAHADSATVSVSSPVSTQRAVRFSSPGVSAPGTQLSFSVDVVKVSNPSVVVSASADPVTPTVTQTISTTPTATCAAADDPGAGFFNRTITVTVAAGTVAAIYVNAQFDTTDAAGEVRHISAEPFGPAPGISVVSPVGLAPMPVPFDLCVS